MAGKTRGDDGKLREAEKTIRDLNRVSRVLSDAYQEYLGTLPLDQQLMIVQDLLLKNFECNPLVNMAAKIIRHGAERIKSTEPQP